MKFQNARVCITGASSGIGEALAHAIAAKKPAVLYIMARNLESLETISKKINAQGVKCVPLKVDVGDDAAVAGALEIIEQTSQGVDIAIANAGTGEPVLAALPNSEAFHTIMNVNFHGVLRLFHGVLPAMLAQNKGHLVAVSSLAAWRGLPRGAAYCASKSALNGMLESYRLELGLHGIQVSTVMPGFVRTPMVEKQDLPAGRAISPAQAATYMVRGIEKNRRIIAFPPTHALAMAWVKSIPDFLYDFIMQRVAKKRLLAHKNDTHA